MPDRNTGCPKAAVRVNEGEKILFLQFRTLAKIAGNCWALARLPITLLFHQDLVERPDSLRMRKNNIKKPIRGHQYVIKHPKGCSSVLRVWDGCLSYLGLQYVVVRKRSDVLSLDLCLWIEQVVMLTI